MAASVVDAVAADSVVAADVVVEVVAEIANVTSAMALATSRGIASLANKQ